MYDAWRFNRDCKLLRDGLQGLSWDGQCCLLSLKSSMFFFIHFSGVSLCVVNEQLIAKIRKDCINNIAAPLIIQIDKNLQKPDCLCYYKIRGKRLSMALIQKCNFIVTSYQILNQQIFIAGRAFSDKVDRLKLAEIVKQAIEEKTNLQESHQQLLSFYLLFILFVITLFNSYL